MIDRTDEETADLIREWLRKYALTVLIGIVLGLFGVYGYQWWQKSKTRSYQEQSEVLGKLHEALLDKAPDKVLSLYQAQKFDGEIAALAALVAAKAAYQKQDFANAENYLSQAGKSKDTLIRQMTDFQKVNLFIAKKDWEKARAALQALKSGAFAKRVLELEAYVLIQQKDLAGALAIYQQILTPSSYLTMQIESIKSQLAL